MLQKKGWWYKPHPALLLWLLEVVCREPVGFCADRFPCHFIYPAAYFLGGVDHSPYDVETPDHQGLRFFLQCERHHCQL